MTSDQSTFFWLLTVNVAGWSLSLFYQFLHSFQCWRSSIKRILVDFSFPYTASGRIFTLLRSSVSPLKRLPTFLASFLWYRCWVPHPSMVLFYFSLLKSCGCLTIRFWKHRSINVSSSSPIGYYNFRLVTVQFGRWRVGRIFHHTELCHQTLSRSPGRRCNVAWRFFLVAVSWSCRFAA